VDGVGLAGHDSQAAPRQQHRNSLGPLSSNERILVAVHDKGPLLDQRQPILDAVGQNGAGS
jgi:hypothetical protein